jgi:uncharacterized protein (TIGR02145 family)
MRNFLKNPFLRKWAIQNLIKIIPFVLFSSIMGSIRVHAQTVTDIDGNVYNTVTIGTQIWMAENLKTTKYSNGELIGTTTPATLNISGETSPQYQWAYDGIESNVTTYGRLYTWYALTDTRSICPAGWHVPTFTEWTTLENYLIANGFNFDGTITDNKIAKALASSTLWSSSTEIGAVGNTDYPEKRNATGFTALPAGIRYTNGLFDGITVWGEWWLTTTYALDLALVRIITNSDFMVGGMQYPMKDGYSVRCLKNLSTDITNPLNSKIEIYPNPVSGILNIEYKSENFETVTVLNSQGVPVTKEKVITPRQQLDFSKYISGLYFLEFAKSSGEIKRLKVLKH